ncbi:alanine--tRNA ligase [Candidatus Micrarchaeota archaeon]|nr:alanine--tRNA ligase [Candidatus Micrarchaeota archaeon]
MIPTKNELRKQFSKDWKKHYNLKVLHKYGFQRQQCKKCGKNFWSKQKQDHCEDPSCIGYQFVGKPTGKKHSYIEAWKTIEKYFTKNKHKSIYTYPSVARWRDDLYFTIASISDFQPYVVTGEVKPPGNPLIIPQACIRFGDLSNVGVTGRHMTSFTMIGQHAFNTDKLFYWKDEALEHDIKLLKEFGIKEEEISFIEDVWMGGGNFGPCIEYFVKGMEIGNCVFMQYQFLPNGESKELKTKVIDMGAGLERFAWITQGTATIYEPTYEFVLDNILKNAGLKIDKKLTTAFWSKAGGLDIEEGKISQEKTKIAQELGMSEKELFNQIKPLQSAFACTDHLKTILFASTDGMLPSNGGGGYNLRMILRRTFGFNEEFNLNLDYDRIFEDHAKLLKPLYPHYSEGVITAQEVVKEELKKYKNTKEKAQGKLINVISKAKKQGGLQLSELITLYESDGIPVELIQEIAKNNNLDLAIPDNFYDYIKKKDEEIEEKSQYCVDNFCQTKSEYYNKTECTSKVIGILNDYIITDKSCFYPESGGQVGDIGTINNEEILETIKQKGVILHKVKNPNKFKKGDKVKLKINEIRRKQISMHHTGAHLLNAATRNILGRHVWQAGSYKNEYKGQLDLTHYKRITQEELDKIELKVNEYIRQNLLIKTEELERNKAEEQYGMRIYQGGAVPGSKLRIVSIGDIDHEACGGTHSTFKQTGEFGVFKIIKREGVKDGIERISFKCGDSAIKYIQEKEDLIRKTAEIISVPEDKLKLSIENLFEDWKQRGKVLISLRQEFAKREVDRLEKIHEQKKKIIIRSINANIETLKEIGAEITNRDSEMAVILVNKTNNIVCAVGKKSKQSAKDILGNTCKQYGGSGGGSIKIAFGKTTKIIKKD